MMNWMWIFPALLVGFYISLHIGIPFGTRVGLRIAEKTQVKEFELGG